MSVRQVHPRSTFQKQFRTRPSDSKSKTQLSFQSAPRFCAEGSCRGYVQRLRAATHHFKRKNLYHDSWIQENRSTMQRHTLFCEIPCIADRKLPFCHDSVQRHTISRGKTCIATAGYRKSSGTMPRHTLFRMIPCIAKGILLTTHKKTTAAPQKKSARIGSD